MNDNPHKEELTVLEYWRLKVNDMVNGVRIATLLVAALLMIGGGCSNGAPWVLTPIG